MGTSVKLRMRPISGNRFSLYLDFYPPILNPKKGALTRREFLGMYIIENPKNQDDKAYNKETLKAAEKIRSQRQIDVLSCSYDFFLPKGSERSDFVQFFRDLVATKQGSDKKIWVAVLSRIELFTGGKLPFALLNEKFCNDFRSFLLKAERQRTSHMQRISQSSSRAYFGKFKSSLKLAFQNGLIQKDYSTVIKGIAASEVLREFLTFEELQSLAHTHTPHTLLKRAALFSALTGIRFSDISRLTWSDVFFSENGTYSLRFRQKKTRLVEFLPIANPAVKLLGERQEGNNYLFPGLVYNSEVNKKLQAWASDAGIKKRITFHSMRHTFATLQLSLGTDIFTVSKLLGHRSLNTTLIYVKIIDSAKREAVNRITLDV